MDIQLKLAVPGDEELIHEMKYKAFLPLYERYHDDETSPANEKPDKVAAQLKSGSTDYYIIMLASEPVGAVRVVNDGMENGSRIYRISPLFILPEYQNCGIGCGALNMLFESYEDADIWRLSTIRQEKGNCHLYEKCGFCLVGGENVINENMTIVYYEKRKG